MATPPGQLPDMTTRPRQFPDHDNTGKLTPYKNVVGMGDMSKELAQAMLAAAFLTLQVALHPHRVFDCNPQGSPRTYNMGIKEEAT